MQIYIQKWKEYSDEQKSKMFQRSELDISEVEDSIAKIIEQVRLKGDQALIEYTQRFDKADLRAIPLQVQPEEFEAAALALDEDLKKSIEFAVNTTWDYHLSQKPESMHMKELHPGLIAGERALPIDSAGLYVPRGRGSFPSMLYMLAVPAKIAGVPSIQIVTPPNPDGSVDAACLYAAELIGIEKVFRVGGAHAIAALAYGTESIPGVLKVVGPGSSYVTAAKRLLASKIDAGLPAGPSESMIIADEQADAWNIALDLMVEAEHGSDSCALLLTDSSALAEKVRSSVSEIGSSLPAPRAGFVQDVFNRYGGIILTESIDEAVEIANRFAPEHLLINTSEPLYSMKKITNAGEILLGRHLPFSAANYSTGANAVLPTGGWAKSYSPVSVRDFIKFSSVVYVEKSGYQQLKEHVIRIADYEGFITHGNALKMRREE
ncbi:MAG: histidinol dehydrogenase [Spirochaetia bacterium]